MSLVIAALILVGVLALANLILTFGVIRRLRQHTAILDQRAESATIAAFSATTVDGVSVSQEALLERQDAITVAFLAPDCGTCKSEVPALAQWAAMLPRERTLVVLDGQAVDPAEMVEKLNPVAQVVIERSGTPVAQAFGVSGFPTFCVVGGGRVVASFPDLSGLKMALSA